jgi:hypothetical protein
LPLQGVCCACEVAAGTAPHKPALGALRRGSAELSAHPHPNQRPDAGTVDGGGGNPGRPPAGRVARLVGKEPVLTAGGPRRQRSDPAATFPVLAAAPSQMPNHPRQCWVYSQRTVPAHASAPKCGRPAAVPRVILVGHALIGVGAGRMGLAASDAAHPGRGCCLSVRSGTERANSATCRRRSVSSALGCVNVSH